MYHIQLITIQKKITIKGVIAPGIYWIKSPGTYWKI